MSPGITYHIKYRYKLRAHKILVHIYKFQDVSSFDIGELNSNNITIFHNPTAIRYEFGFTSFLICVKNQVPLFLSQSRFMSR